MPNFLPSHAENEEVALFLLDDSIEIKNFTEYSFRSNFLADHDQFTFVISANRLSEEMQDALVPGKKIQLKVNDAIQATGYIDSIEIEADRQGGTTWRIEGRDSLAQAGDACADPTVAFKEGQTLADVVKQLFKPYGYTEDDQFVISNEANVDVQTNKFRQKTQRSAGKGFSKRALRDYKVHQAKPYPRESVFGFARRLSTRYGLWLWASADGKKIIVSQPDFESPPIASLLRNGDGTTNVLKGSVRYDVKEQPTAIVADGYDAGGEFGRSRIKVILANSAVLSPEDDAVLKPYIDAGAKVLGGETFPTNIKLVAPRSRVLFLHDDESRTLEQLENFVRREMALLCRKSLQVSYTVEGHGQMVDGEFVPWTVDTTVQVLDEPAGLHEVLYVLGRTFQKTRASGTFTTLELIRLNTLVFSDNGGKSGGGGGGNNFGEPTGGRRPHSATVVQNVTSK